MNPRAVKAMAIVKVLSYVIAIAVIILMIAFWKEFLIKLYVYNLHRNPEKQDEYLKSSPEDLKRIAVCRLFADYPDECVIKFLSDTRDYVTLYEVATGDKFPEGLYHIGDQKYVRLIIKGKIKNLNDLCYKYSNNGATVAFVEGQVDIDEDSNSVPMPWRIIFDSLKKNQGSIVCTNESSKVQYRIIYSTDGIKESAGIETEGMPK